MGEFAGLEIGSWAELLSGVASVAAAFVSIFALRTALAANATAERTRSEAKVFADETRERERSRQHADVARQLQAWWVKWNEGAGDAYGVFVTNAGEGATVFRDIRIETRGNSIAKGEKGFITFTSLPPGSYVLVSNAYGSDHAWGEPQAVRADVTYEPLLKAQKYAVTCISFEDPTKQAWCWTPERGLESAVKA
ncbi:hypothetical protein [Microbacterium sp. MYb72]|uniref:hypothetical protein n=1 Tax=unclassified Microbacterium TaxID=2609290 RepID=UPI0011B065DF|nr:hypothetical protein [Microbacterium sp. MYb72]